MDGRVGPPTPLSRDYGNPYDRSREEKGMDCRTKGEEKSDRGQHNATRIHEGTQGGTKPG